MTWRPAYDMEHGYPIAEVARSAYLFTPLKVKYTTHRRQVLREAVARRLAQLATRIIGPTLPEQVRVADCYRLHHDDVNEWKKRRLEEATR